MKNKYKSDKKGQKINRGLELICSGANNNVMFKSVMLYGSEIWQIAKELEKCLLKIEMAMNHWCAKD